MFITGGNVPSSSAISAPEPLIVPGAAATLIGWADQSLPGIDDMTINGSQPAGQHEKLVQMPLNIDPTPSSHTSSTSPGSIPGQLIDTESYDAQLVLPGIYTMGHGFLTFEFPLADPSQLQAKGLTIQLPDLLASGPPGSSDNSSYLQARLYNWQKGTWDSILLNSDTFSTANMQAYAGSDGRVLMRVSGSSSFSGNLYFEAPSLNLV
jgi:hypothetical protein